MRKMHGYSQSDKARIAEIASQLIEGQIEKGDLACTDEAIKAAMPQAVEDARLVFTAASEFMF